MPKQFARLILPVALLLAVCAPSYAVEEHGAAGVHLFHNAPPRARMERRSHRPSSNHTWIGGYWEPRDDQWAWSAGRWEEPSERGFRWVGPRYHHEHGGYRYEAGRWSR